MNYIEEKMRNILKQEAICARKALELLNLLAVKPDLDTIYIFPQSTSTSAMTPLGISSAFRLTFINPIRIKQNATEIIVNKISIAYPSDIFFNRVSSDNLNEPRVIETCLISNDDLCYVDSLGYSDVKRFFSIDELIDELVQIGQIGQNGQIGQVGNA